MRSGEPIKALKHNAGTFKHAAKDLASSRIPRHTVGTSKKSWELKKGLAHTLQIP